MVFKNMLAGYKSTIAIALGDANIRTSAVTSKVLREYKELITNTTADLEEHLQKIDNKIQTLSLRGISISDEDAAEREQILEERDSTQQCLGICAQVFTHIDQVQPTTFETIPLPAGTSKDYAPKPTTFPSARLVTIDGFKACKATLSDTTTQLESHLRDIDERLQKLSSSPSKKSNKQSVEQETIREELESIKQCLAICAQASTQANQERTNVFEDIAMADDGHQVLVSTIGDLVSARRVTAGARSLQFLGQMSDDSLQQLSRQRSHVATERVGESEGTGSKFKGLYGEGFKLSSKSLTDLGTTIK